jgi:hypothetical protein
MQVSSFLSSFRSSVGIVAGLVGLLNPVSGQSFVDVDAHRDNTLYESDTGALSNGAGAYLFAGATGTGALRRALVLFDVNGMLPAGVAVDSVNLVLTVSKTQPGTSTVTVHRVLGDWGEGNSNADLNEGSGTSATDGDATWLEAVRPDVFWTSPGGDFDAVESAGLAVGAPGSYTWYSTERLSNDVRSWINAPGENHGWLVKGEEGATQTAKRFNSRENVASASRPRLRIWYSTATEVARNESPAGALMLTAWPDPFHTETTIAYEIDRPGQVTLSVFDLLGRQVRVLESGLRATGRHEAVLEGSDLAPGLYLYRLQMEGGMQSGTVLKTN